MRVSGKAQGTVSSLSFGSVTSDLESGEEDTGNASGALPNHEGGSVYVVRGSVKGDPNDADPSDQDSSLRYLPLGMILEDDDAMDTAQCLPPHDDDDEPTNNNNSNNTKSKSKNSNNNNSNNKRKEDGKNKANKKLSKRPYKRDAINKAMASAMKKGVDRRDVILSSLKLMGITAFIIDSQHAATTSEVMEHVKRVITFVGKENRTFAPSPFQRCLLYQDRDRLLYNLTLPKYSAGLAGKWQEYVDSFSAFQATLAVAVLMRSLPCSQEGEMDGQLKPAYLALLVATVLVEEVSLSWANVVMMVQACPSISAYSVTKESGSDWMRKLILFLLAVGGAATGKTQVFFVMTGILLTCAVLLANLGARAWYFFQWQPLNYNGPLSTVFAYVTAIVVGFAVPFLGHRTACAGGKPAIESVIRLAVLLSFGFIISDFESVKQFLIVGKEACDQTAINTVVGIWFSVSLVVSVYISSEVTPIRDYPDEEPLLEENHESPVGYLVPNLPNFPIDPCTGKRGMRIPLRAEIAIGIFLATLLGTGIVSLAYTDWGTSVENGLTKVVNVF
ncbi:expressed unknown protein [Seminavis robusta]|uniref:Uncharacterized protein n=1 Tax=Seminavis robusta TaxID=568900 RepID=A0A9N8EF07_9STRA|nr:expressed unknown protein [Seminavis robusta]|eukprot:Sro1027_g233040.1 n/a (560) ;mRNA; f:13762-15635